MYSQHDCVGANRLCSPYSHDNQLCWIAVKMGFHISPDIVFYIPVGVSFH